MTVSHLPLDEKNYGPAKTNVEYFIIISFYLKMPSSSHYLQTLYLRHNAYCTSMEFELYETAYIIRNTKNICPHYLTDILRLFLFIIIIITYIYIIVIITSIIIIIIIYF